MWTCGGQSGKKEDKVFHDFVSPFLYFGMAIFFARTFMCPFFLIHSSLIGENFGRDFYGARNIKEGKNEWMVWKCYPSGVEVLACGGGVYVILDHESMKSNSQGSQNLTKLKMTQAACKKIVSL